MLGVGRRAPPVALAARVLPVHVVDAADQTVELVPLAQSQVDVLRATASVGTISSIIYIQRSIETSFNQALDCAQLTIDHREKYFYLFISNAITGKLAYDTL